MTEKVLFPSLFLNAMKMYNILLGYLYNKYSTYSGIESGFQQTKSFLFSFRHSASRRLNHYSQILTSILKQKCKFTTESKVFRTVFKNVFFIHSQRA